MSQNAANQQPTTPKPEKRKYYAVDCQNERPFLSIDRECFRKTMKEKLAIFNFKKAIQAAGGKIKGYKFTTLAVIQY